MNISPGVISEYTDNTDPGEIMAGEFLSFTRNWQYPTYQSQVVQHTEILYEPSAPFQVAPLGTNLWDDPLQFFTFDQEWIFMEISFELLGAGGGKPRVFMTKPCALMVSACQPSRLVPTV